MNFLSLSTQLHLHGSVIDLDLFSWLAFHAPNAFRIGLLELAHKALHRLVGMLESVVIDEILPDALGVESVIQFAFDEFPERFAMTLAARRVLGMFASWLLQQPV